METYYYIYFKRNSITSEQASDFLLLSIKKADPPPKGWELAGAYLGNREYKKGPLTRLEAAHELAEKEMYI